MSYPPRSCEYCGTEYTPHQHNQRFCSVNCKERARNGVTLRRLTCPECGREFETYMPQRVHCSLECRLRHQHDVRQKNCKAKRTRSHHKEPQKRRPMIMKHPLTCEECGRDFLGKFASTRFCSAKCCNAASERKRRAEKRTAEYDAAVDGLVEEARATWGSEAFAPQDDDAMTYGNMLYL